MQLMEGATIERPSEDAQGELVQLLDREIDKLDPVSTIAAGQGVGDLRNCRAGSASRRQDLHLAVERQALDRRHRRPVQRAQIVHDHDPRRISHLIERGR